MGDYRKAPTWLQKDGLKRLFNTQDEVDSAWKDGWNSDTPAKEADVQYAVMMEGRKRALKLCDSLEDAQEWVMDNVSEEKRILTYFEERE